MAVRTFESNRTTLNLLLRVSGAEKEFVEREAARQQCSGVEVVRRLLRQAKARPPRAERKEPS